MNAEFRRIKEIFLAAVEKSDPAERDAYLHEACGQDEELRRQVDALLRKHTQAGSFLESPAPNPVPTVDEPPADEAPGTTVGAYKLIEQIGEGGMGAVWMAQQTEPVKRLVAVKLIKAGMDSRHVFARFEAERQALALMDHTNIARVLDGGTTAAGRPYFVMDLVKGVPITRYCDEHRLTPRQRLELFVPVCQAVQHAHQKGVIHRDLKPSNVLVALYDGRPVPKVIDFGVAKAAGQALTDKTLVTGFGTIVGTLEYMSPEQAEVNQLDMDTRSDVYSLGVLLYELLAGSPPFTRKGLEQAGMLEMLRVIREEEPSKPSMKLSTAEGLPTLAANRGTEPAKLTRLVRGELDWIVMKALEKDRNRRYETANGFALDVQRYLADEPVLACPPSAGYRFRKFARRNKRALLTVALLGAVLLVVAGSFGWMARDRAARLGRNGEAVAVMLVQCEDALQADRTDLGAIALEAAERRAADGGAEALAVRLAQCRADLSLLRALDDIDTFRWTWTDGGLPGRGVVAARWRAALADYGVTPEEGPAAAAAKVNDSLVRDRLLIILDGWLAANRSAGVRAVLRSADPGPYRDAIRDALIAGDGKALAALGERREALDQPTRFAAVLGSVGEVPANRRRAVLESALQARHGDLALLMELGNSYPINQPEGAVERVRWFQAALAAHPRSLSALNSLGIALLDLGNRNGAVAAFREAVRLEPTSAIAHNNLGIALQKGDPNGSIAAFREAIRLDPNYASPHNGLGLIRLDQRDPDGAIASFLEAIRLNPRFAQAHYNMGKALRAKGDPDGAIAAYKKAIEINPNYDHAHSNLGNILCDVKRDYDGAITQFEEAVRLDPKDNIYRYNLGNVLLAKGNLDRAIACFKEALRRDPAFAHAYNNLGNALLRKGELDGAIVAFREAIHLEGTFAPFHSNLAQALLARGDPDRAAASYRVAIGLNPKFHPAHNELAWLLATGPDRVRDGKQAVEHATRACALTGWKDPGYIDTLAAAHAEAGAFDKAVLFQKQALAFPGYEKDNGQVVRERLHRYERKMPYRDPALVPRRAALPHEGKP
jgi:tetratricopeptide (TPR) repeat protein/serine/threonine protein kinase